MPHIAYFLNSDNTLETDLDDRAIENHLISCEGLLWVDFYSTNQDDGIFLEKLGFHPLAVEDCVSEAIHSPKVDDFDKYLFLILHGVNYGSESKDVETAELAIFIGANFVITNHNFPLISIETIRSRLQTDLRLMLKGSDFLAYSIIDSLIDNILPAVDHMTESVEEIEETVIHAPVRTLLETVLHIKRSTIKLYRVTAAQREVMNRLSRGEFKLIRDEARIFYRDIYDHIVRIQDLVQAVRDMSDNALSTYLSSIANQQNETMKILSIFASIFMPLTLLTGIYGMNFDYMPELRWKWAYFCLLGFMVAVAGGTFWWLWLRTRIAKASGHTGKILSWSFAAQKSHMLNRIKQTGRNP